MGQLLDGKWTNEPLIAIDSAGRFVRKDSLFRNWVTPDGSAGPTGKAGFKAESGRYHLYVSYACPWAHRTIIFRTLKGLEEHIGLSVVHPHVVDDGWEFRTDYDGATGDPINNYKYHHQLYSTAQSDYTGRATVPVLWDKKQNTIVSNESSEIIRMLNSAFDEVGAAQFDFYPKRLRKKIDAINEEIYHSINNGVYKAGFAKEQTAYDEAVSALFEALDGLEERLAKDGPCLLKDSLTEADWRLFVTLIRFDAAYVGHFKCNIRRIADYPHLSAYLKRLYDYPGIAETVRFDHIKAHYYYSHPQINPTRIVPKGPAQLV